jgi:phenylacetate-coenzyme A ligase PaaK-like adenylate-forming protein
MLATRAAWSAYVLWHLRGQAAAPFRPWPAIERDQGGRVRAMIVHAVRHVPYYRDTLRRLGLQPADFRSATDLARLPLIGREDLQRDPEAFLSTTPSRRRLVELRTGGSAGAPRSIHCDPAALFQNLAHSERDRSIRARLLGRKAGYRQTLIASERSGIRKVQEFLDAHALFPRGARIARQYLSLAATPAENVARLSMLVGPCPCGRSLPRLSFPAGRTDDVIRLDCGRLLHPQAIRDLFTEERGIWQYQVVQEGPRRFRIDLVAGPGCDRPVTGARLAQRFAERFGAHVVAGVRFVEDVERTGEGKARAVAVRWVDEADSPGAGGR